MTVAIRGIDYRATNEDGSLDLGATVTQLRKAEAIVDRAAAAVA